MIMRRSFNAMVLTCFFAFVLSLAAAGAVWADTYTLGKEIREGISFGVLTGPIDVDVRADGRMFVADQSNRRVLQFNEYGDFVWGCLFPTGFLPIAIGLDHTGSFYYVSRFKGAFGYDIIRLPASNSCASTLLSQPPGGFNSPFGIATGGDGSIYVADTNNDRIVKYDANGVFVTEWGESGNGDGDFHGPMDVAAHPTGIILVADTGNDRVQGFLPDGTFAGSAGTTGTGDVQFNSPSGIGTGPDGAIFVADTGNNRVQKGFLSGAFAGEFGNAELSGPNGLAVDNGGNVSVADVFNDRIAIFAPDVLIIDDGTDSRTVTMPAGVAFSIDLQPDSYWNSVFTEVFAWAEGGAGKAYLTTYPSSGAVSEWALFGSLSEIAPVLTGVPVTSLTDIVWTALNNSTGLAGDWKVTVCLDRQIDGILNPSYSVCDSINVTIQ